MASPVLHIQLAIADRLEAMKFNTAEIAAVLQQEIEQFERQVDVRETGTVIEVGDGIARVWGLANVMAHEMVEFPNGVYGWAFNLEESSVGVIIKRQYTAGTSEAA